MRRDRDYTHGPANRKSGEEVGVGTSTIPYCISRDIQEQKCLPLHGKGYFHYWIIVHFLMNFTLQ